MFLDDVDDDEKPYLMAGCAAYVLPSKPRPEFVETFGIALAEKMLAGGGAVITTDTGGIGEAVGDRALIVPVESPSAIAAALDRVLAMPPDERAGWETRARRTRCSSTAARCWTRSSTASHGRCGCRPRSASSVSQPGRRLRGCVTVQRLLVLVLGAHMATVEPGGGVAHAVQRGAGAAVDDLAAAVAEVVEPPLLVVAAVPRRLPARRRRWRCCPSCPGPCRWCG